MPPELKEKSKRGDRWMLPISIVVAGLLVAGGLAYRGFQSGVSDKQTQSGLLGSGSPDKVKPVNTSDHILGNPEALVKIVEFSDTECPFCKDFQSTMRQIMSEYGAKGQVAWIYRHFPISEIHPKARKEAEATECANELGGNQKFWAYINRLYEVTPSNNNLDPAELPKVAEYVGLNRSEFETCLVSGKYADKVEVDYQDAINSGGVGTPYSIVISKDDKKYPINGGVPYSSVKGIIDIILQGEE